ncbi:DNA helicase MCM8 [Bacillus rossius redtenbacheri]|uniref:DNA helicase MCM8 n=1 Tax=Bacillus rossius redtenbacheri TaxID=93214 RepID=UPI002FDDD05E
MNRGKFPRRGEQGRGFYPRKRGWQGRGRGSGNVGSTAPATQLHILDMLRVEPGPYRGWKMYFPQEAYRDGSSIVHKVHAVEKFIAANRKSYSHTDIEVRKAFTINIKTVTNDIDFSESWPNFMEDLTDNPESSLGCVGLAMHQYVLVALEEDVRAQLQGTDDEVINIPPVNLPMVRARPMNFEPVTQLKNLKASYYGKLVSVRGTIIRVGNVKLLCTWMAFHCTSCLALQCVRQPEGIYTQPTVCIGENCKSRTFVALHSSEYTQTVNWQSVRLQELVADDNREGGRIPRTIECELLEDLLDSCVPGDIVMITGIVKVRNNEDTFNKKAPSMFLMYIEAVSVVNSKNHSVAGYSSGAGIEFNIRDYYAIQQIHAETRLFWLLVNSLCPTIYGHEMVKAGLLLALFGGSAREDGGRADIHVLVVGDPGLGKSQMLQACAGVAPRGVYVCGNTSTASGLTVTLSREGGGNYALEAGALVLADQGCCCIDEFDKMSSQHSALLEAMEQQSISIAKAGVVCSLPARTSVLAAANPTGGHYQRGKTVSENLRLGSALLSRFDLVFILLDRPDERLDGLLSEHVMALHAGLARKATGSSNGSELGSPEARDGLLRERLRLHPEDELDPVPHRLLRKYVGYARRYVRPYLSPKAADILQRFYLELRRQRQGGDGTPVTTRQLESLVRLAEARAKLELREEVTERDALDVVEVMRHSLVDTLSDEFGRLDFRRSQHGSGSSSHGQAKRFVTFLHRRADTLSRSVFSVEELKEVAQVANIQVPDFFGFLSALNLQGFLLKKGPKLYQLLSVDY